MHFFGGVFLCLWATLVSAQESVAICYGYGCFAQTDIRIEESDWRRFKRRLSGAGDAEVERKILSGVIGDLYALAGQRSPIRNDRGGNYADEGVSGAMDCIDHSTTTTRFLRILERRGALRWHVVLPPEVRRRFLFFEHYSAAIAENAGGDEARRFVVDSWFVDNGKPAVILPLDEWKEGAGPDV